VLQERQACNFPRTQAADLGAFLVFFTEDTCVLHKNVSRPCYLLQGRTKHGRVDEAGNKRQLVGSETGDVMRQQISYIGCCHQVLVVIS